MPSSSARADHAGIMDNQRNKRTEKVRMIILRFWPPSTSRPFLPIIVALRVSLTSPARGCPSGAPVPGTRRAAGPSATLKVNDVL